MADEQGPLLSTDQLLDNFLMLRDDSYSDLQVEQLVDHLLSIVSWGQLRKLAVAVNKSVLEEFSFAEYLMYK